MHLVEGAGCRGGRGCHESLGHQSPGAQSPGPVTSSPSRLSLDIPGVTDPPRARVQLSSEVFRWPSAPAAQWDL